MLNILDRKAKLILFLVLLLTFACYLSCLNNQFTKWDDNKYITTSSFLEDMSWTGSFWRVFTTVKVDIHQYHPLTNLSWFLEKKFFGLNPAVFIFNNIVLHCLNTFLVFLLIYCLFNNSWTAFITSVLFGIHPMHVESVAWIAERKDVLYTFFYLLALINYSRYCVDPQKNHKKLFWVFILFLCSLLSKPAAVSLPVVLLVFDYFYNRKFNLKNIGEKTPFFLLASLFGFIAMSQTHLAGLMSTIMYTALDRSVIVGYSFFFYITKLVLPVNLCIFYPFPAKVNGWLPFVYYCYAALSVITCLLVWRYRSNKDITFGFLMYLSTIFLILGIVKTGNVPVADRYSYLPSVGVFYLFAYAFSKIIEGASRFKNELGNYIKIAGIMILVVLSLSTVRRCNVWSNGITVWSDVIKKYPKVLSAYQNRGSTYAERGQFKLALKDFEFAMQLNPMEPGILNNMGYLNYQLGNFNKAVEYYTKSISVSPLLIKPYLNRAQVYEENGAINLALNDYLKIQLIKPKWPFPYKKRYDIFMKLGNTRSAQKERIKAHSMGLNINNEK